MKESREVDILVFLFEQELKRSDEDHEDFSINGINKLIDKWGKEVSDQMKDIHVLFEDKSGLMGKWYYDHELKEWKFDVKHNVDLSREDMEYLIKELKIEVSEQVDDEKIIDIFVIGYCVTIILIILIFGLCIKYL